MASQFSFIQTSEIHLDGEFKNVGEFAPRLRNAVAETFRTIINIAKTEKVDAILIAGNLFDSPIPSSETVKMVKNSFAEVSPVKIIISPGRSDPVIKNSVYLDEDWPENVYIFKSGEIESFNFPENKTSVYGFAHMDRYQKNPFRGYKINKKPGYDTLLLMNAAITEVGYGNSEPSAPIKFSDIIETGCDFAALGFYKKIRSLKAEGGKTIRACYAGTPQGIDFSDEGEKGILKITIEDGRKQILFIPASSVRFHNVTLNCDEISAESEIIRKIEDLIREKELENMPVRVSLTGSLDMDKKPDIDIIRSSLSSKFEYVEIKNDTIIGYNYDKIKNEQSVRGIFTKSMLDEISNLNLISNDKSNDKNETADDKTEVFEMAMRYGIDALRYEEVRKRWL